MQSNYLIHHGVKGMHWGVRRYQNADGTLTGAGRKRYSVGGYLKRSLDHDVRIVKSLGSNAADVVTRKDSFKKGFSDVKKTIKSENKKTTNYYNHLSTGQKVASGFAMLGIEAASLPLGYGIGFKGADAAYKVSKLAPKAMNAGKAASTAILRKGDNILASALLKGGKAKRAYSVLGPKGTAQLAKINAKAGVANAKRSAAILGANAKATKAATINSAKAGLNKAVTPTVNRINNGIDTAIAKGITRKTKRKTARLTPNVTSEVTPIITRYGYGRPQKRPY